MMTFRSNGVADVAAGRQAARENIVGRDDAGAGAGGWAVGGAARGSAGGESMRHCQ